MEKVGKGFSLAFFLLISFFCQADDLLEPKAGAEAVSHSPNPYPAIARLDWRDDGFKRLIADVEANRRKVFLRERYRQGDLRENTLSIAETLTFYRYVPLEGENIFSIAARCSIPYWTLASLNNLSNEGMLEAGKPFLVASAPGIFVPEEPDSDLAMLLASSRMPQPDDSSIALAVDGQAFIFFPGEKYNATEMAFFLNTGFRFPLKSYRLTSSFGMRKNPVTGNMRLHQGIDLAAPAGTEVYAAAGGVVTEVGSDPVYGNYIIIKHNNNWASLYGHLQKSLVDLRANVRSGTLIGLVGSTGQSTGPHLHFELQQNGKAQDPDKFLFRQSGR